MEVWESRISLQLVIFCLSIMKIVATGPTVNATNGTVTNGTLTNGAMTNATVSPGRTVNITNGTLLNTTMSTTTQRVVINHCSGREKWRDGSVNTACTTVACAKIVLQEFSLYMGCNDRKRSDDVLIIATRISDYVVDVTAQFTRNERVTVVGNGTTIFATDQFVVGVGYINKAKSNLHEYGVLPDYTGVNDIRYWKGLKDVLKFSKIDFATEITTYYWIFFKNLLRTGDTQKYYIDASPLVKKLTDIGAYTIPDITGKWVINSQVVQFTVAPTPADLGDYIEITFNHREVKKRKNHQCISLQGGSLGSSSSSWSTKDCHHYKSTVYQTICRCKLYGIYAIVSEVDEEKVAVSSLTRTGFTTMALAISTSFMFIMLLNVITAVVLGCWHLDRIKIYISCDIANFFSYLAFLYGVLNSDNLTKADTAAGCINFFQVAVMSWVFVEGLHNYHTIVPIFDSQVMSSWFFYSTLGWGIPAALAGACSGFPYKFDTVNLMEFTWMKVNGLERAYFWAGPAVVIIGVLVIYGLLFYELTSWIGSKQDYVYRRSMQYLRRGGPTVLLTLLPWFTGMMAMDNPTALGYHYFFLGLYSFQGLCMFVFHLLKNTELWEYREHLRELKENDEDDENNDDVSVSSSSIGLSKMSVTSRRSVREETKDQNQDKLQDTQF